jgi:hypothetical protein
MLEVVRGDIQPPAGDWEVPAAASLLQESLFVY